MPRPVLTTLQRRLVYVVAAGAVTLALIGFVGSYAAVRQLAVRKGFGTFALVFPVGLDAGIVVLLALDLLLTWLRMPFPLLRQTAWLLTAATIAFNGAAAWPDPLGVGMHAVIPVLFVVVVEAGRNAIGRIADITAEKHMDGVRLARWLLSPLPTFLMWRRMKLWEMRSYEQVVQLEQDRLVYLARLQARYGRSWRRKAPVEALLPLRLAKYGRPLAPVDVAPVPEQPEAFEAAAAEALALAPPVVPAAYPAVPDAYSAVPGRTSSALRTAGTLVLDLAPMHPPIPELTAAYPAEKQPRLEVHAQIPDVPEVTEDELQRGRELAATGPMTVRRFKAQLHVGQDKAKAIISALTDAD